MPSFNDSPYTRPCWRLWPAWRRKLFHRTNALRALNGLPPLPKP